MKFILRLLMCVVVLTPTSQALAELTGLRTVEIQPADSGIHGRDIKMDFSGRWFNSCIPQSIHHEIGEGQITITLVHSGGPTVRCGGGQPPWQLETTLGPLTHGNYDIFGQVAHRDWPDASRLVIEQGPELLIEAYPVHFLLGDMSGDGVLDAFDLHAFELALSDVEAYRAQYLDVDPVEVGNFAEDTVFNAFDTTGFEQTLAGGDVVVVPEPAGWWILAGAGGLWLLRNRRPLGMRAMMVV